MNIKTHPTVAPKSCLAIALMGGALLLSSCSLEREAKDFATLFIEIPGATSSKDQMRNGPSRFASQYESALLATPSDIHALTVPSTSDGFDCLAINIMGEGIPSEGSESPTETSRRLSNVLQNASYCSYPGITTAPISIQSGTNSVTMQLQVPAGSRRVIQMVGMVDPYDRLCTSNIPVGKTDEDDTAAYELGRSIVDLFSDQGVSISNQWNSASLTDKTARRMDCTESCRSAPNAAVSSDTTGYSAYLGSSTYYAQAFTVSSMIEASEVRIQLTPSPPPAANETNRVQLEIRESSSTGGPASTSISSMEPLDVRTAKSYSFSFASGRRPLLWPGTTYWIVLKSYDALGQIQWEGSSTDVYQSWDTMYSSDGSTWTSSASVYDFNFQIFSCGFY